MVGTEDSVRPPSAPPPAPTKRAATFTQWRDASASSGGNIDATLVDAEEKHALAQATGLDIKILEYWLGNTRKKARKQAATGYM